MINSLYDNFKHWSSKGSVWIISDPHFDDADCKLMSENWPNPGQYVKSLNKQIMKTDTLICLGDVGNPDWVNRLRAGYKILITGNHDRGKSTYLKKSKELCLTLPPDIAVQFVTENDGYSLGAPRVYSDDLRFAIDVYKKDVGYFDEVYDGPLFIADRILLSHEPIYGLEDFCVNIHGHCHSGQHIYDGHINLAANVVDFQPFNLGKAVKDGILSGVPNYHRNTIDWATEHSINKKDLTN